MNKSIISFVVATFLIVAFVQKSEAQDDAKNALMKKNLVEYVKHMVGTSEDELNTKEVPELLDISIAAIKKHLGETNNIARSVLLKEHLKYYQGLKDGPQKPAEAIPDLIHHVKSEADFDEQVKNAGSKIVVVDFFATWCGPCRAIAPYLKIIANKYQSQVVVLKVDVDELYDFSATRYDVSSMPTFIFLKNGEKVEEFSGADDIKVEETIESLIN